VTAEPARPGWAQADCSDGLLAGSNPVDCSAGVSPDGLIPDGYSALLADGPVDCSAGLSAAQARVGWAQADYSAALPTDGLADCSAELSADGSIPHGRGEQRCSRDARLAYWPLGWLLDACLPKGCKALLPLWPVRPRGR
jgi:hypothetical protein